MLLICLLSYNQKTSFNHKNLTPDQYCDTFWVQKEFIVHNMHLKIGFCEIWQKSMVVTVKHDEKYEKKSEINHLIIDIF